ncbi:MAG: hypothetical protein HGA45_27355 [Chloroflexales bacterium]|nr:hypothetical protein [Chloroflexales bacterium]
MRFVANVDLSNNQLLNVVVQVLAGAPASPAAGRIYYDSTLSKLRYYNGTGWVDLGAPLTDALTLNGQAAAFYLNRTNHTGTQLAATISDLATAVQAYRLSQFAAPNAPLAMGSQRITGLADPTSAQDAATQAYVLAQISNLVSSAPAVLDTLNELAAALGNDPNFATTMAAQLAAAKDRATHTGTQTAATISDFTTAADARQAAWGYAANVGDGSATSIVVTHNLNTRDIQVELVENAAPYEVVYPTVQRTTVNTVTLLFATAPTAAQYRALIRRVA